MFFQINAFQGDFSINSDLLYRFFQVGTNFATDRDFAALDFLDHELLGDGKPERPYNETVDFGLEKLVLQFLGLQISPEKNHSAK